MPDSGHIGSGSRSPDAWLAYCLSISLSLALTVSVGAPFKVLTAKSKHFASCQFSIAFKQTGEQ